MRAALEAAVAVGHGMGMEAMEAMEVWALGAAAAGQQEPAHHPAQAVMVATASL